MIEDLFTNSASGRVIDAILEYDMPDFTTVEISRSAHISPARAVTVFMDLVKCEVIIPSRTVANREMYKLNESNPIVTVLRQLASEMHKKQSESYQAAAPNRVSGVS